jgi:hypothetical protein
VADAGDPAPGGRLTRKPVARIPRPTAGAGARTKGIRDGNDQLARQEAVMAIAIRTAQATREGPLASGPG